MDKEDDVGKADEEKKEVGKERKSKKKMDIKEEMGKEEDGKREVGKERGKKKMYTKEEMGHEASRQEAGKPPYEVLIEQLSTNISTQFGRINYKLKLSSRVTRSRKDIQELREENHNTCKEMKMLRAELEALKGISRSFQGGEARDRLSLVDHGGGQTGFVDRSALVNEMGGLPAPVNMMGGQPALFVTPPQILREVVQGGEKRVKRETYSSRFLVSPFTAPRAEQDEVSALDAGYMDPSRSLTLEELNLVKNAYDNEGLSWLRCLWRDESWVDDEGINLYMEFLTERRIKYPLQYPQNCLFVNTFFMRILEFDIKKIYEYGAGDHNNREDLGGKVLPRNMLSMVKGIHEGKHMWEYDCVYFPLNARERHWFLAVLYPRRRMLELYDSLHYEWEGKYDTFVKAFLEGVRWIFHIVDDGNSYWEDQWTVEMIMATPKQNNGYDCGVYVMKYIDFLCSRKSIDFGRDDIPKFRKTLSFDCLQMYRQYAVVPQSVVAKRESKDEVDIEEVKQLVGPEVEVLTKRKKLASKPITNRFLFRKRKKDV
ncbi:uncharacterized protein LOC131217663 isoform X2 [Magnolia sinica]|uniref:uncharacterized protein LOC131217663 isoform X2 n=1 Tax=Magnolia sinica TaxID=86752 RepID=UPI002659C225|nr:uncharacterized protein LOC131217663 isoform X2 [Magnolia sinica]XP_058068616.1 uncharacterized protein LOC131217663 isoform X2 [Magnolia sinica]